MATMDSIRSELTSLGQGAIAGQNPVLLAGVVECMTKFNKIQHDINTLKKAVDGLQPSPSTPTGQIA